MIRPAGKVTVPVPGTPVIATINLPNQGISFGERPYVCHAVMFQALRGNTGAVFIGTAALDAASEANLFAVLAIPTTNSLPSFSAALTIAPNGLVLNEFYIDAAVAGDGVLVTFMVT